MKQDVYVYAHAGALYINLTNRCTNDCTFCLRNNSSGIDDYNLWLNKEPEARDVIEALGNMENCKEVVFCGFGEPMIKIGEILEIAAYVKQKGIKTRINTNGQANAYHGYDVAPKLKGLIDTVSISLNAATAEKYDALCRSVYGLEAFAHVVNFAKSCVEAGLHTVLTVVDVIGREEIERAQRIAQEIGAELRVRNYIRD